MTTTITANTDIRTYVHNVYADFAEHGLAGELVEALQYAEDRPDWGDDWSEWLDTQGAAIAASLRADETVEFEIGGLKLRATRLRAERWAIEAIEAQEGDDYDSTWPDDEDISRILGVPLQFIDRGDTLLEAIFAVRAPERDEPPFAPGDLVCGGAEGTEDYDEGRVLEVDGDQVTVGWSNGERTTQSASLLRAL